MDKTEFKLRDLEIQLCQFSTILGSKEKMIELSRDFGKNHG